MKSDIISVITMYISVCTWKLPSSLKNVNSFDVFVHSWFDVLNGNASFSVISSTSVSSVTPSKLLLISCLQSKYCIVSESVHKSRVLNDRNFIAINTNSELLLFHINSDCKCEMKVIAHDVIDFETINLRRDKKFIIYFISTKYKLYKIHEDYPNKWMSPVEINAKSKIFNITRIGYNVIVSGPETRMSFSD